MIGGLAELVEGTFLLRRQVSKNWLHWFESNTHRQSQCLYSLMVELRAYTSAYGARLAHGLGSIPSAGTSISMLYLCNKLVDKFVCCAIIHSCVEKSACRSESCLKTTNKKSCWQTFWFCYNRCCWVDSDSTICSLKNSIEFCAPFVYRLGRWVFNPVRGVRFPYGVPYKNTLHAM